MDIYNQVAKFCEITRQEAKLKVYQIIYGESKMEVKRKSIFSGKTSTMELDIRPSQISAYNKGALIQDAFPNLTADEREFLMTGAQPGEWDSLFREEET